MREVGSRGNNLRDLLAAFGDASAFECVACVLRHAPWTYANVRRFAGIPHPAIFSRYNDGVKSWLMDRPDTMREHVWHPLTRLRVKSVSR